MKHCHPSCTRLQLCLVPSQHTSVDPSTNFVAVAHAIVECQALCSARDQLYTYSSNSSKLLVQFRATTFDLDGLGNSGNPRLASACVCFASRALSLFVLATAVVLPSIDWVAESHSGQWPSSLLLPRRTATGRNNVHSMATTQGEIGRHERGLVGAATRHGVFYGNVVLGASITLDACTAPGHSTGINIFVDQ